MASEIINMLRGSTLIKKALEIFVQMIDSDEYLYNEAWRVITTQKTIERIPQYFYNKDIEVNEQEKEIRRLLFEHLSIRPKHDVSGILSFYMGKNTPERKDYIMGNLVVPVEA